MRNYERVFLLAYLLMAGLTQAQKPYGGFIKQNDVFGTRVFIENKGQFDTDIPGNSERILYQYQHGSEKIYFTDKGLVHVLTKTFEMTEEERERMERGHSFKEKQPLRYYVRMHWQNANPTIAVESGLKQSHYFTYGSSRHNASAFKKITYRNVYEGIDFEYTLPDSKQQGIKYNVILHPGARAADIKMVYSGDVSRLKQDKEGNVIIKTPLDDLIEYAPNSFYSTGEEIPSAFRFDKKTLAFDFPQGYDTTREAVIDPWITAITTLSINNCGYDVDYDYSGNLLVYGGGGASNFCKIAKYNALGVLLWTFSGALVAPAPVWNSGTYAGNFVVRRSSGKVYTGQGFNPQGAVIIRLDVNGNYDNLITPGQNSWRECWEMAYHCTTDKIYGMGGSTTSNQSAGIVDQVTGTLQPIAFYSVANVPTAYDVVSHAIDELGDLFWVYANAGSQIVNNRLAKINSAFTSSVWTAPSTFNVLNESSNKSNYAVGNLASNGFNCLAVNANYLFYYDGLNLAAYNKANGSLVANTTVPLLVKKQGGIAVDDCNNLYLGGNGSILSYNFNGTSFSTLTSIPLALGTQTNQYVFDIKLDKQNKTLYVSGIGFVGNYSAVNTLACPTATTACFDGQVFAQSICAGNSVVIVVSNPSGLSNPIYSLQPGNLSNSTGSFVLSPTATAVYSTYVTGTSAANVVITQTGVATVTVFPSPLVAPTVTQTSCTSTLNALNLNLTFAPATATSTAYSVIWSPIPNGVTSATQTAASGGIAPGVYSASVISGNGCVAITSININPIPEPANFIISPAPPYVINCFNPTLTLTYFPATHNYTTTNLQSIQYGPTTVFTSTNSASICTVLAQHPVSGCVSTQTFVITQNGSIPTSVLSPTFQNITCTLTTIQTVTANATPTVNVQHLWFSPLGGTYSVNAATSFLLPQAPGVYTHVAVDMISGCTVSKTFTVFSSSGFPTFNVVSPQNFTLGCFAKGSATINLVNGATSPAPGGPISYALVTPTSAGAVFTPTNTYYVSIPGTYTAIVKDLTNSCETKVQFSVILNNQGPTLDVLNIPRKILDCDNQSVVLEALSSTPYTSYNWAGPAGNVQTNTLVVNSNTLSVTNTLVANFTLTLKDNNNYCLTTTVIPIYQNLFPPKPGIALSNTAITCVTGTITLTNQSSTGIPPGSIFPASNQVVGNVWEGPTPMQPLQISSTYVGRVPGIYTLTARDLNNGCLATKTIQVADFRNYPLLNRNGVPEFTLDCGMPNRTITVEFTPLPSYSYTWTPEKPTFTGVLTNSALLVTEPGTYYVTILNNLNGCENSAVARVVDGSLNGAFEPDRESGFAPLPVTFSNTSSSSLDNSGILTVWNFGNGYSETTKQSSVSPVAYYKQPGSYTVTAYMVKGNCRDTVSRVIKVDIPSLLEIPNVFSPNGDGVNDVYFLKTAGLVQIDMVIFDRWGHKVFETKSEKGNIAWDGKNRYGKDVAEGVYFYKLKAMGSDGASYEKEGNITLLR